LSSSAGWQRSELDLRSANVSTFGHHPNIACERDLATASHRGAVDGGDHRFGVFFEDREEIEVELSSAAKFPQIGTPNKIAALRQSQ